MEEPLSEDLVRLKESFGRYTKILFVYRLLRDIGASAGVLRDIEGEIGESYERYLSARETAARKMMPAVSGSETDRLGEMIEQALDETILGHRRDVLRGLVGF